MLADVYRRQILTIKVDLRAVRVKHHCLIDDNVGYFEYNTLSASYLMKSGNFHSL